MKLTERGVEFIQKILESNEEFLKVSDDCFIENVKFEINKKAYKLDTCEGGEVHEMIMEFVENE